MKLPWLSLSCLALFSAALTPASAADSTLTVLPASPSLLVINDAHGPLMDLQFAIWGPAWGYGSWQGPVTSADGTAHHHLTAKLKTGATLTLDATIHLDQKKRLVIDTALSSDKDTDLTLACLALAPDPTRFDGGRLVATQVDGTKPELPMPLGIKPGSSNTTALEFAPATGAAVSVLFDPPATWTADNAVRLKFAANHLAAGETIKETTTVVLPQDAAYYPTAADVPPEPGADKWYTFQPDVKGNGPNELSLADWLDAPAGKHGRIADNGPDLVYNGKPIRLWGLNDAYGACSPEKAVADKRADFYSSLGINAVRLHKYADGTGWGGIQSPDSCAQLDPVGLDRMDYFISKLKEKGIYVELSPVFIMKLGEGDRAAVPYMDEFGPVKGKNGRVETQHGSLFLSSELQGLLMTQMTTLLAHKNPYTGLTYAEDPAIAVIEMYNEDDAFFFGTMGVLKSVPTLRKRAGERFTAWLKARYGTEQALLAAWGDKALNSFVAEGFTGESWDQQTILPLGNPWFYAPEQLEGLMAPRKQRLLDTMQFLYELQNDFYSRYKETLRKAGYAGELVSGNWIAGNGFSNFYNLNSDAQIGIVDRHNYFGGVDDSMLPKPGSGILSSGMLQVSNRPFMLSEWISTFPNEFASEAPAIVGAYGMGLQGWDVSFMFQNGDPGDYVTKLGGEWEVATPNVAGVFPAIARQVLRGDVKTSELTATRYVCVPALQKGELGFDDRATQRGDVKTSDSVTVPVQTLAVARSVVEFTDQPHETKSFDLAPYLKNGAYNSSTGQLSWQSSPDKQGGWFTINTPATQAVVGFASGQRLDLHDVTIEPSTKFAAIYLTAQEHDRDLTNTHAMLVTAMARSKNTGMKIGGGQLLTPGTGPIQLEPVVATLTLKRKGTPTVYLLDHAGHRTGATLPVKDGQVMIDGGRDQTPYYLITW